MLRVDGAFVGLAKSDAAPASECDANDIAILSKTNSKLRKVSRVPRNESAEKNSARF